MSLARKEKRISVEEYFDLQRNSGKRYDFWDGKLIELEATTKAHNRIKRNLIRKLEVPALSEKDCKLFDENVMTQLKSREKYVYPDIVISCNPEDNDPLIVQFPFIIIEVLPDGTEQYDRTEKFFKYQRIPTVEQCVFVSQKMMAVESFIRSTEDQWLFKALEQPTDQLVFPKLGIDIRVEDIYQGISLKTEEE
ncbi:MAG: Uma2 family endonuclease [Lewinellaceae bacterium]|nr:Uma2 family endonuclease [Phaeodactylibacter sp.]MCB9040855.1 Uma2 family endonuclease [Lewinellaceae bacterium]